MTEPKDVTMETLISHNSLGWDKGGVFLRLYHPQKKKKPKFKVIGKIYISDKVTFLRKNYFARQREDGYFRIFKEGDE